MSPLVQVPAPVTEANRATVPCSGSVSCVDDGDAVPVATCARSSEALACRLKVVLLKTTHSRSHSSAGNSSSAKARGPG